MSAILIATVPAQGHVGPLLPVARHFVERGDDVRFLTGSRFAGAVQATGARHVPLPPAPAFDDQRDPNEVFPERATLKGTKAIAFDMEHFFVRPARDQYETVMSAHREAPATVILADTGFLGAAFVLGHPLGDRPPVVVCGVVPLPIMSRDTAPYGMGLVPMRGPLGRLRNRALGAVAARTVFPRAEQAADEINRDLHARPLPFPVLDWPRHAEAIAQFTVAEFEYPRSDAPETLHFVGPITSQISDASLPSWWSDLDGRRPVVHVTQGTVANHDYGQIIAPTLEALARDDVLVVVATGGQPLETLPPLPANARAAVYLPYDQFLPKVDVYVTNGGYGGVQHALRHGVPVVTSGGKEDKPEVAGRIAWSGAGRRLRTEEPSATAVRDAVRAVLGEPRYRENARRIAASMARAGGVARLAELVDELAVTGSATPDGGR